MIPLLDLVVSIASDIDTDYGRNRILAFRTETTEQ